MVKLTIMIFLAKFTQKYPVKNRNVNTTIEFTYLN